MTVLYLHHIGYYVNAKNKIWLILGITVLITSVCACFIGTNIDIRETDELLSIVMLIVEIIIGVIITLIVFNITKNNEKKIQKKISEVLDIVKEREKIQKEREKIQKEKEKQVYVSILSTFEEIENKVTNIINESKSYKKSINHTNNKTHKEQIKLDYDKIKQLSENVLDDPNKISSEFFDLDTVDLIKTISNLCKKEPKFNDNDKTENISVYNSLKDMITPRIAELKKKTNNKIRSKQVTTKSNYEEKILSVSSDRIVYPLNSTMHMRAYLGDIITVEKINFEVFNSARKLLLSQLVDPQKNDYPGLAQENIFQACFKMEGDEWKVGETYIVRATHGSTYSEDSFIIEQRMPVVLSDKPSYVIGSDMILTVIDPDADKDNEVVEFVGDSKDSKVVIESKYGKIDGYRLRETGDSTGIFQGIVGILGIRNNGTVIPKRFGEKLIEKIQGVGIDDGFIGGRDGDEIIISYKNKTKAASLSITIANL